MFFKKSVVMFMGTFFVFCDSGFVDNLPKCKLEDGVCFKYFYEGLLRDIGKDGIPELKIPPVDPIRIKNVSISLMDTVNITVLDGIVKGVKDCIYDNIRINITQGRGYEEVTCDLSIKGRYRIETKNALIKNILGGKAIHGEGNGKLKIEKLNLKIDFPFYAQKRSDGEIYWAILYDYVKYTYKIKGVTSFSADNLYIDNQEISKGFINTLNNNSGFIMSEFGQPFIDKAMKEFYFKYAGYFFDVVPARYYIIDDLTPYART
ncbi:uncharacterized protein LOC142976217 [Anticarsia gemmatalis]|uniref:uncharacterized protein LOC142976217 n=1 Tax=Anticarsia gemmatalis TaxID=129554 RepID=UPI003F77181B